MLPSTTAHATFAVVAQACRTSDSTCTEARGGVLRTANSKSRIELGVHTLGLEKNLGVQQNETGAYGTDTVALGLSNATSGPILDSQIVIDIATNHYRMGIFGLNNQPQNISNFTTTYPSFLTTLKSQTLIHSLSWAYTAGAHYRKYSIS